MAGISPSVAFATDDEHLHGAELIKHKEKRVVMGTRQASTKNGHSNGHSDVNDDELMAALAPQDDEDGQEADAPTPAARKSAKPKGKEESRIIEIPAIKVEEITVGITGKSPLIHHRFSSKAKKEMLDKQMGKAKAKKEAKDPEQDFLESLYTMNGELAKLYKKDGKTFAKGAFGFPALAFKAAAVDACRYASGLTMTMARGAFYVVVPEQDGPDMLIPMTGSDPLMREDVVRIGGMTKTTDLRYRGEFKKWSTEVVVRFNKNAISASQIVNLFNLAGFHVGVGEWRMEKGGINGCFDVHPVGTMRQGDG